MPYKYVWSVNATRLSKEWPSSHLFPNPPKVRYIEDYYRPLSCGIKSYASISESFYYSDIQRDYGKFSVFNMSLLPSKTPEEVEDSKIVSIHFDHMAQTK